MRDAAAHNRVKSQLWVAFLGRAVINIAFRIIYPFLPSIARGLGISLESAGRLVSLRVIAGLGTPFFGPLADRYGRRRVMEVALLLFSLASLIIAGLGTFTAVAVAFVLYGIIKALYDPAAHAYVGDTVPYARRGTAVGIVEFSWSASWLIGVPASGFLIERFGWRAPWAILIILGLLGFWLTRVGLPSTQPPIKAEGQKHFLPSLISTWRDLLGRRVVFVFLLVGFFLALSLEPLFIVYGAWLEDTFGLSISTLGLASTVVGLAEATAELGTTMVTDRLGKRRSVLLGLSGLGVSFAMLPWLGTLGLVAALVGIALMMLTFEFSLVSLLPLATELVPDARASLLALTFAAVNLGRVLGTYIGGWLWLGEGITLHAGFGVICALGAVLLVVLAVREVA